jgi:hypothetical protein
MILMSDSGIHFLRLDLLPLDKRIHLNWHSYRIMVGLADGTATGILAPTKKLSLYMDAVIDPEIPAMCDGLTRVALQGGRFVFEPIDERDFIIEAQEESGRILLKLDATEQSFGTGVGWPSGVHVSPAALLKFARGLMLEFELLSGT